MAEPAKSRIDIDQPLWDQSTFIGRLKHFAFITDFRIIVLPTRRLEEAKTLLEQYRIGQEPPGTTEEQIRYAKKLYDSAFHPDSGELQNVIGRMSCQVPGGMILAAGMLQFYKSNFAVVLWQWMNQSFNALVNYTNRNAASEITNREIAVSYFTATSSALVTALGLKALLAKRAGLVQRLVPFAAVAAANMVNIPFTRQTELLNGVATFDENGNKVTDSKLAAYKGISQVVFSRIIIAAPGMCVMPFVMEALEKKAWFNRYPRLHLPFQTFMVGAFLTFMVPIGCALFPQKSNAWTNDAATSDGCAAKWAAHPPEVSASFVHALLRYIPKYRHQISISTSRMARFEREKYEELKKQYGEKLPEYLYFNKGL